MDNSWRSYFLGVTGLGMVTLYSRTRIGFGGSNFSRQCLRTIGHDKEAAYQLAAAIVRQETKQKPFFENLLKNNKIDMEHLISLLSGFPSAMIAVLPFLKTMSPTDLLAAYQSGALPLEIPPSV